MNAYVRIGAAVLAASSLAACATITRGTKQKYEIVSEPAGADVSLTTGQSCVTPCKLKLKRKDDFTATISKPGYETVKAEVESKVSGGGAAGMAGNVLVGGIIGGVVDATNGSLNSLFPDKIDVKLIETAAIVAVPAEDAPLAESVGSTGETVVEVPAEEAAPEETMTSAGDLETEL